MKSKESMPLLWGLIFTTIILTILTGFAKKSAYASYSVDLKTEPFLSIFMQGIGNREFPFEFPKKELTENIVESHRNPAPESPTDETIVSSNPSGESVTGNTVSGNSVSGNSVSGNSVSCNFLPEDSVSGNTITIGPVPHEYFDDALFIGDSRTDGLSRYSTLTNAVFYAKTSSTIYNIMDQVFIPVDPSEVAIYKTNKINIRQALSHTHYKKIYIMVGINELGTGTPDTFLEHYKSVISEIRALQPDAIIYIQSIMHVTTKKSDKDPIFNNDNIDARNDKIKTLANNKDIFYLDVNPVLDDATGGLNPELTFDEVHLKASRYSLWESYLLENGVVIN